MLLEIAGRADDHHFKPRRYRHRHHAFGETSAQPNAGIAAVRNDVGKPIVDHELQLEFRVTSEELADVWLQHQPRCNVGGVKT